MHMPGKNRQTEEVGTRAKTHLPRSSQRPVGWSAECEEK